MGFEVYPALDCASGNVGVITQALADRFAHNIAAHPADWHMLQPQWLADLPEERRASLGRPDADRHGLPVLVRRSRRGAVTRAAAG
ncbi:bacterial lipid A biosynthesis acyltransferase family protein [Mycobacterium xenopi 3993]|nr:bacterial lipid A biosynthesis acyltransferase family protein [Mycobacterium xenopi 3993]